MPDLIEAAKRGIMLAGALPMVFPTMTLHESFAYPTAMYLRNLMAMETEELIRCQPMDAVLLIGGCDKTLPAQLMAAVSANVPAIVLPTGPMVTGQYRGETIGACTDCRRLWAEFRAGRLSEPEIREANGRLAPSVGTCMVMGTASTMACATEALGMSLPMSATALAANAERRRIAEATGRRAAEMAAAGGPVPADIVNERSLWNALTVVQAIGGSTNALIHLCAIAGRCGIRIDLDEFDRRGRSVPLLVDLKPSGSHYMEHLHYAGGVPAVMGALGDLLDIDAPTVAGVTLRHAVSSAAHVPGQDVIRTRANPLKPTGGLAILRGNLAPDGAVIKQSAASEPLLQHTGPALVFRSVEDMTERIDDPDLPVTPETVLVLRNAGPKGAPGMPEAGNIPIPKKLAARGVKDMVRISDARMSGTAYGTVVLHIAPESAVGGPLALVRNGDLIRLDVPARRLDLLLDEQLLAQRRQELRAISPSMSRGYERLFLDNVLQADEGCDFGFLR